MDNICRICWITTQDLLPMMKRLNENTAELLGLGEMFEDCLGIEVAESIQCTQICVNCKILLNYFYDFKMMALQNQLKLRKILKIEMDNDNIKNAMDNVENVNENIENVKDEHFDDLNNENKDVTTVVDEFDELYYTVVELPNDECNSSDEMLVVEYLDEDSSNTENIQSVEDNSCTNEDEEASAEYLNDEEESQDFQPEDIETLDDSDCDTESRKKSQRNKKRSKWMYNCETCRKSFRNEMTYNAHINVHKGLPPYWCEQCEKGFGWRVNYEYHLKKHNNNRRFSCSVCSKKFLCNWDLKIHLRVHADIRPYICDICGKQFRVRSHMTDHMETHNEQNRYECPICQNMYKTKATLKIHTSSIHLKKTPFTCSECNKSFYRKHHLNVHYKVHSKDKK